MNAINQTIADTVGCCYEDSAVPFRLVMKYAGCTADDVTRAVRAGEVKMIRKVIGPGGVLLQGLASLFLVPSYVD
jgi:hypothetical protein